MGHLIILEKGVETKKVGMGNAPITVGREKDNTLSLRGTPISRYHCRILPAGGDRYKLLDLGSANGTRLNGRKVHEELLYHEDRIELGDFTLVLHLPGARRPASAPATADAAAAAPGDLPRLLARGGGIDQKEFLITGVMKIGRGAGNDISLDFKEVSGTHARILPVKGGARLEDLGSTNGTRVNGNLVRSHVLGHGDEVEIGSVRFLFLVPGESGDVVETFEKRRMATDRLFALVPERGDEEVEIDPLPFTLGRDSENHLALDDESLSGRHARFFWEDRHMVLEDLDSTNGTFVKGRRIDRTRVGHGTEIEFGTLFFLLRDVDYPFPRLHRKTSSRPMAIGVAVVLGVLVLAVLLPLVLALGGGQGGDPAEGNRLKKNPSFEGPPGKTGSLPGWTLKGETFSLDHDEARHGGTSLQVKLPGSGMAWSTAEATYEDRIGVAGGKTYVVACRLRAKDTSGVAGIRLDWFRRKESRPFECTYSDLVTGDTDWLAVQTPMTAPRGAHSASLALVAKGDGGVDWFDDVRFGPGPPEASSTLTRIDAGRVKVWLNRRGLASVFLDRVAFLRGVGAVFWDRRRVPKASQELCLPAEGFPRVVRGEFLLRAEAVKLAEGLPIPFEFRALCEEKTAKLVYRFHADAGRLVNGDRIAVALRAFEPVQTVVLSGERGEERLSRGSFGSVSGVREILLRGPRGDLAVRCDPPLTVNGLAGERDVLTLYTSVGVTTADLGHILEITLRVGLPPDRQEERAARLLERAEEQLKARRLGKAYVLFATVVKEYGGVPAAKEDAESRMRNLREEFERQRSNLEKTFADFRAAPSPSTLSAFLFRLDEVEDRFAGMEEVKRCSALREEAFDTYGHVAGAGFEKARKALAEAKAAYETGDWVHAEELCARLLTETQEEALLPGARAILSEIRRRREDREEMDAWVEGRVRAAKALETRGDKETAREVYREILKRYPRGEWAQFAEEQIRRLER